MREFGVDRVISRSITAPGEVEQISVAVVMDDGSLTGAPVPALGEIEALVGAAVGLDPTRGDSISVSTVAFPEPGVVTPDAVAVAEEAPLDIMAMLPQAIGGVVLLIVSAGLLLMSRSGKSKKSKKKADDVPDQTDAGADANDETKTLVGVGATTTTGNGIDADVFNMVQRQPEEIATLLRGWLADRE